MVTASKKDGEVPTSNIPSTAQAYVAPKKAPTVAASANKFGIGTNTCPRCNKGICLILMSSTKM